MKTAFYWGMLGCAGGIVLLTALVPSARVTAKPPALAATIEDAREERLQSWSIPAANNKTLRVNVQTGSLKVIAGQTKEVVIQARRIVRARNGKISRALLTKLPVTVEQKGNAILINDVRSDKEIKGAADVMRVELELDITAPAGVTLEAAVTAGNTQLLGRIGKVSLQTQVGNVTLERQQGISGEISVGTGSVTLGGEVGNLTVQTRTGEIRGVRLQAGKAQTLAMTSGTGNIWMSLEQLPKRSLSAKAVTGDVVIKVPEVKRPVGAKVLAHSSLGASRVDYGLTFRPLGTLRPTAQ